MKITNIEVTNLRFTYPPGQQFDYAGGACTGRLSSLIRVSTDDGIEGIGSVYSHPDLVRMIVEQQLRDLLIGEDPLNVEAIWDKNYRITRWYGRKGAALSALGGIDVALWDIRGKAAGKPIYQMLGAERHSVPAYASALLWKNDPAELADEAARHLSNGFRAMKTRLGRNYEYDLAGLQAIRNQIGPGNHLMVEGNARYSLEQAQRMLPHFREASAFWLEEPFTPEDVDNYLALRPDCKDIPLAAGENEFGVQGFRELMGWEMDPEMDFTRDRETDETKDPTSARETAGQMGGQMDREIDGQVDRKTDQKTAGQRGGKADRRLVDIVQPDASRAGGITECHRIGKLAAARGFRVATHTWSDAVALVANMHLIASLPTAITVEVDQTGNPFIEDLLAEPLKVINGEIAMPQKPGLGIELNQETVERYALPQGAPTPEGNYSDMVFGPQHYAPAGPYT
jgi:L-alanine-DL-glutamate epimerase-like enolase superfamily enzyme